MQITIYAKDSHVEEISHFLKSDIPYEHNIIFYEYSTFNLLSFPVTAVTLFYDDYVRLKDWQLQVKNRTKTTTDL